MFRIIRRSKELSDPDPLTVKLVYCGRCEKWHIEDPLSWDERREAMIHEATQEIMKIEDERFLEEMFNLIGVKN